MGPFDFLVLQRSCSSLSNVQKTQKKDGTQVRAQMLWDNNGDDDNDHGQEWMENHPIYNKVLN